MSDQFTRAILFKGNEEKLAMVQRRFHVSKDAAFEILFNPYPTSLPKEDQKIRTLLVLEGVIV